MRLLKRYIVLIIALFISALYFNMFQLPNKIVTGGIAGISIIINNYFGLDPSRIILFISLLLLVLGTIFLGIDRISGAIVSSIIYPFFIKITENIYDITSFHISNMLIISIILGILFGITTSMVYKVGFSIGGLAIVSEMISKYTHIPISKTIFFLNFSIVLIGGFSIGIEMIIYALIILSINSLIIDLIFKKQKLF